MTGRIKPIAVVMCDDIRHEADGGFSLMGVSTPSLQCIEFPARRRMAFGLIVDLLEEGDATFLTSLKWKGEVRWQVEHTVQIEGVEKGTVFPIEGPVAGFEDPGTLSFEVDFDGVTHLLQEWQVDRPND